MQTDNFARSRLETYEKDNPLGLQRVVASVMLDPEVTPEDCATVEAIVLALIPKATSLQAAARMGILRSPKNPIYENSTRMAVVTGVLRPNVASDLLAVLMEDESSDHHDIFALNTAYHFIEGVVAADPVIRREAAKLLQSI